MTILDDPQPKKTPTLEDCLALMKTAKGCELHTIRFFENASCDISAYDKPLMAFDNIKQLHEWLTDRQPSRTVTVEIDRKDAEKVAGTGHDYHAMIRVESAIRKALEA